MMEISISRLGCFSKKADCSGKTHPIAFFRPTFKHLLWKFPTYLLLTLNDLNTLPGNFFRAPACLQVQKFLVKDIYSSKGRVFTMESA
jgi:hypothetical protein